ncbi:MAG TPA: thioredoxin family protein [Verrucomicrobiae bacterium]|nr:thioredoxin family protein [Verrucomicrobiae bacterium]
MANPIKVIEVSTPGCVHCAEAKEFFEKEIKPKYPNVEIVNVSVLDPAGQELVGKYMIFASPGIIINDQLFSTGGVSKTEFIKKIEELSQ